MSNMYEWMKQKQLSPLGFAPSPPEQTPDILPPDPSMKQANPYMAKANPYLPNPQTPDIYDTSQPINPYVPQQPSSMPPLGGAEPVANGQDYLARLRAIRQGLRPR